MHLTRHNQKRATQVPQPRSSVPGAHHLLRCKSFHNCYIYPQHSRAFTCAARPSHPRCTPDAPPRGCTPSACRCAVRGAACKQSVRRQRAPASKTPCSNKGSDLDTAPHRVPKHKTRARRAQSPTSYTRRQSPHRIGERVRTPCKKWAVRASSASHRRFPARALAIDNRFSEREPDRQSLPRPARNTFPWWQATNYPAARATQSCRYGPLGADSCA